MAKKPTTMHKRFEQIPQAKIARSTFNRSHGHKTTFDAGLLIPIFVDEALPGDTFNLRMSAFARLNTPIKPVMDNMWFESFFFAVPYRLVWTNWERFMGEQDNPDDTTDYLIPQRNVVGTNGFNSGTLQDYMGIPVGIPSTSTSWTFSALPQRAYMLIWNDWFRDQNLQQSVDANGIPGSSLNIGDGPDTGSSGGDLPMRRGKRHDYFTSCLPWPQKGPAVSLPLGDSSVIPDPTGAGYPTWTHGNPAYTGALKYASAATTTPVDIGGTGNPPSLGENLLWENTGLVTQITSTTINSMREAFQIQKLLERDARGGTRYIEIIKSHFGVTSPDARLQRPEYLGGGRSPVNISPVAQTSAGDTQPTPQGNLAAIGTLNASGHGFVKSFTEHCIILGMIAVRADLTYQQGLERMWSRKTRYDHFWPAFSGLGEQSVLNKEIYTQDAADDDLTFGYQERFAEYRYKPSRISGLFRSNVGTGATSIHIWHLSEDFGTLPTLGDVFIQDDPPVDRIVAVTTEPDFMCDTWFQLKCARPMPVYGVPGLIDHF